MAHLPRPVPMKLTALIFLLDQPVSQKKQKGYAKHQV